MSNKDILKSADLVNFDSTRLQANLGEFKKELFNLRFRKVSGEVKNISRFKLVRRNIARIKTEINRRKGN